MIPKILVVVWPDGFRTLGKPLPTEIFMTRTAFPIAVEYLWSFALASFTRTIRID